MQPTGTMFGKLAVKPLDYSLVVWMVLSVFRVIAWILNSSHLNILKKTFLLKILSSFKLSTFLSRNANLLYDSYEVN